MKNLLFTLIIFNLGIKVFSQENPVKLSSDIKHVGGNVYELIINAEIEPEWAMYSQNLPKGGAYPTTISYKKKCDYLLIGKSNEESNYKKIVNDETYKVKIIKYYNSVVFKQKIKLKNKNVKNITADVEYMVCSSDTCLPPTNKSVKFNF